MDRDRRTSGAAGDRARGPLAGSVGGAQRRGPARGPFARGLELEPPLSSAGTTTNSPGRPSLARMAWIVVAVLWAVALLSYLARQMLGSMKFSVMADIPTIG